MPCRVIESTSYNTKSEDSVGLSAKVSHAQGHATPSGPYLAIRFVSLRLKLLHGTVEATWGLGGHTFLAFWVTRDRVPSHCVNFTRSEHVANTFQPRFKHMAMGNCFGKSDVVSTLPTQEHPQQTSIPTATISTPPSGTGTANSPRLRTPSQSSALPKRRHHDGRDYPPTSSGGDAFILQFPDQEIPLRQIPSGGEPPMDRARSLSVGATASKGAPSHPSPRRSRATSTAAQGSSRQRVKSTSSATSQTRQGRSRVPFALRILLPNDFRYAVRP